MRSWVRLAETAIQAEFPSFELCQSFSVFNLHGQQDEEEQRKRLQCVAKSCCVNFERMKEQWAFAHPYAQKEYRAQTELK